MGSIDPKGTIGKVILAGMLACVAAWAGLIVLLAQIITSPGGDVAAGALLVWAALTAVLLCTTLLGGVIASDFMIVDITRGQHPRPRIQC